MADNEYLTLSGIGRYKYTQSKSVFCAIASPCTTKETARDIIDMSAAEQKGARHNVYAYLLREGQFTAYSDDGEPPKTAGLPTLGALTHNCLIDCVVVVARHFGGILLGTGGLVRAYSAAAQGAVQAAGICTISSCVKIRLELDYALYDTAKYLLDGFDTRAREDAFMHNVQMSFVVKSDMAQAVSQKLAAATNGKANITVSSAFYAPF